MQKTLPVSAIKNGTVIDHIAVGQALRIIRLLKIIEGQHCITVGINLPSKRQGLKDLIKIESRILTSAEAGGIMIFAPEATINIIENFEVAKKIKTLLPESVCDVFVCPNAHCITHNEPIASFFFVEERGKKIKLICKYCEQKFERDQIKEKAVV